MNLRQITSKYLGKMADPNYHELAEVVHAVMKGVPYAGQSHFLQHQL